MLRKNAHLLILDFICLLLPTGSLRMLLKLPNWKLTRYHHLVLFVGDQELPGITRMITEHHSAFQTIQSEQTANYKSC